MSEEEDEYESNPLFKKPMHLLQPSSDRNKLALDPEALAALKSITKPVVLVTIVGMFSEKPQKFTFK